MSEPRPSIIPSRLAQSVDQTKPAKPLVLIVDDHADTRDLLRYLVEMNGCSVVEAFDGEGAIRLATTNQPDLILMDIKMPDIDGLAATAQIRQTLDVPVIVLSAQAQPQFRQAALDAGADDYFIKPIGLNELELAIRS